MMQGEKRRSFEKSLPSSPYSARPPPPMLKELQHLAIPPPPPPAPLPHARRTVNSGALGSGMIEIVMDEDDNAPAAAPNDGMVPVLGTPAPRARGHNRGRSVGDGLVSARTPQPSMRVRSASRTRKDSMKSPPLEISTETNPLPISQLKSPIAGMPPPVMFDQDAIRSPIEPNGKHLSTGLHRSEMF